VFEFVDVAYLTREDQEKVVEADETPPLTHRLVYLAEKSELDLNDYFNLEARYPDERFSFYKRCTKEFTVNYLNRIEEMKKWLLQKIQLSKMSKNT
jgi:hypothetical protein